MNPRHVLMTADAVGGVWTYALDLARGLVRADIVVTLAVLGPVPAAHQRAAAAAIPGLSLVETGLLLDWMAGDAAAVGSTARAIAALARECRADLVHLNSPALAAEADFDVPVIGACHSCLATWWAAVRTGPAPEMFRWHTQMLGRAYRACDILVAPTRAFADATASTYGIAPPRVVHNGRPGPTTSAPGRREPFVLAAGRLWDDGKDIATLDRAARWLDVPVVAAGPLVGPNGESVALANLQTVGNLPAPELAALMARAAIFVSTARYEPFGLSVLEAAQAGCALVLSDIPTLRELWDGAARFVPPGEPRSLAAALQSLLEDTGERDLLASRARERSRDYGAEAMAAGVLALYRDVCVAEAFA